MPRARFSSLMAGRGQPTGRSRLPPQRPTAAWWEVIYGKKRSGYESQNNTCIPFPATIQGRGANVYAIGVCCPNPYSYVDLDTYTCTNHFLDMVDGWALKTGYAIGNGSQGTILDCHDNWTYWIDNYDSASSLPGNLQAPVLSFVSHSMQMYVLGDCAELMVKDFSIIEKTYVNCITESGRGPQVTLINNYCDASIQGFVLDAASASSSVTAVNMPMTTFNFGGYADQAQSTVAVLSTTNFQGTARFTSSVLWGGTCADFNVNGGDVGFDMVHMDSHSFIGSVVNGGAFHLVNNSAYISYSGASNFPPWFTSLTFGVGAGIAGKADEFDWTAMLTTAAAWSTLRQTIPWIAGMITPCPARQSWIRPSRLFTTFIRMARASIKTPAS